MKNQNQFYILYWWDWWIKFIFPGPRPNTTTVPSSTGSVPLYPVYIARDQ